MYSRHALVALFLLTITSVPLQFATAQTGNPHITSVTQFWARSNQEIQISGNGFGSLRPYDGDSASIQITDLTQGWSAGHTGDPVTLNIGTWSDSLILINYFDGNYGIGNQSFVAGDVVSIRVWNAQTGAGPVKAQAIVLANATGLYNFQRGSDSAFPKGGVILDSDGNIYGTANQGGIYTSNCGEGCGTVYELTNNGSGVWSENVLHYFGGGADGANPVGSIVRDSTGNVFGVTTSGGTGNCYHGCGTVYEIAGGTEIVLHSFQAGTDGADPFYAGLVMDASGNLYGTTNFGGSTDNGTVYELSPNGSGGFNYSVIYSFQGGAVYDGSTPYSELTLDSAGNLYGTTYLGGTNKYCDYPGPNGCGTVYELSPAAGGGFTERVIYRFQYAGSRESLIKPVTGVTFDGSGNLYGVIVYAGPKCVSTSRTVFGCGAAYVLSPQSNGTWQEQTIFDFSSTASNVDAAIYPDGDLTYYNGIFYGYAQGGASQQGSIYTITLTQGGWSVSTIYSFSVGYDGGGPVGRPTFGSNGTMYGATNYGGLSFGGVAFSLP